MQSICIVKGEGYKMALIMVIVVMLNSHCSNDRLTSIDIVMREK